MIDVSQSVEHDHPNALDFLRKDCTNIHDFFKRKGVAVLSVRDLFEFITMSPLPVTIGRVALGGTTTATNSTTSTNTSATTTTTRAMTDDEAMNHYLEQLQESMLTNPMDAEQDRVEDEVFKQSYIPRRLEEVANVERDVAKVTEQGARSVLYHGIAGVHVGRSTAEQDLLEKVLGMGVADGGVDGGDHDDDDLSSSSSTQGDDSDDDMVDSDSDSDGSQGEDGVRRKRKGPQLKDMDKAARQVWIMDIGPFPEFILLVASPLPSPSPLHAQST